MKDNRLDPAPKKAGKPIWPKVPAGFVRSVLAGHSALGLAFAALIYLVCFSGSVAVFAREFQRWEQPNATPIAAVTPAALQTAMEQAIARSSTTVEHVRILPPTPDLPRLTVSTDADGVEHTYAADAAGRLGDEGEAVWTEFMVLLHTALHLPRAWGGFVVGLTGVALLSSLISGVLAHPRVFKDAFHLRWGGAKRLQEADLHNRAGVWALPFHVIVSLTGALLGLSTLIVGILALAMFQGDTSKAYALFVPVIPDDPRPAVAPPDLAAAVEAAQRLAPDARPTFISIEHPAEQGQTVVVNVAKPNRVMAGSNLYFDGRGRLLDISRTAEPNLGQKILASLGPLHFGWFGGIVVKIAYGLLGLALTAVTASGVAIWLARRRDKGRPAPRWERIWIGAVWSQPLAFAASALIVLGLSSTAASTPLLVWGLVTGTTLGLSVWVEPARLSRILRLVSAVALGLVVLTHLVRHGAHYEDSAAWAMNGALAAISAVLAWTVMNPERKAGQAATAEQTRAT